MYVGTPFIANTQPPEFLAADVKNGKLTQSQANLWLLIRLSTERRAVPAQDELQPAPLATPVELEDHLGSELDLAGWSRRGV